MTKKLLSIGILGLLCVAFIAVLIFKLFLSQNLETEIAPATTELSPTAEAALQREIEPLIASGDSKNCETILDETYKIVCRNNIALNKAKSTGDVSFCQEIDNAMVPRSFCESQIVLEQSIKLNDIGVCLQAQDSAVQASCTESFKQNQALPQSMLSDCNVAVDPIGCRAKEIFLSLTKTPSSTNCSELTTTKEQSECEIIKSVFINKPFDPQVMASKCLQLETSFSKNICFSMNFPTSKSTDLNIN